jgi:hypothetical protein
LHRQLPLGGLRPRGAQVFGIFEKAIAKLLDKLLDPLVDFIRSWFSRVTWRSRLIAVVILTLPFLLVYHNRASVTAASLRRFYSVATRPDLTTDGLTAFEHRIVDNEIDNLVIDLDGKLTEKGHTDPINVWTASQIVVAINGDPKAAYNVDDMRKYLDGEMYKDCNCWREYASAPAHTVATAWVLLAVSALKIPENDEVLRSLLDSQKHEGWWPIYYSATDNPENESTYATAMATWALSEHLKSGMVRPENRQRVHDALIRARAWLVSKEESGKARWPDYPRSSDQNDNEVGLSGLVLHVLHRLDERVDPELDREWLDNLPIVLPSIVDADRTDHPIFLKDGQIKDSTRYFKIQWIIVATVDSFPSGSLVQKVSALAFVETAIYSLPRSETEAFRFPWSEAELLISLRRLNGKIP